MNDFDLFCLRNSICTVVLFNFFALWITSESVQNSFRDLRVISHITTLYMTYSSQMSFIFNGRFLFCFLCLLFVPFSLLLSRSPSLCLFILLCACVCAWLPLCSISLKTCPSAGAADRLQKTVLKDWLRCSTFARSYLSSLHFV